MVLLLVSECLLGLPITGLMEVKEEALTKSALGSSSLDCPQPIVAICYVAGSSAVVVL